ncbi:hypothetical protein H6F44_05555 [Pseudanabaena sp. FACHB-1277]|jgi:hypothetical protein|uniref:Orc1-like AAA ATPase domain-containing protein n=1 Tax=Pseudanabaena cinerea FACHB-1277 TaxID=2949581 RepID=A0A926URW0_9CYAN|nr:hypothetical protein [Pseudanabaena cinerea]MBD2149593.1 hypothetical protein [Pseudanabaena cinerea FACHB-1277]
MSNEFTDPKIINQLIEQHNPFSAKVTAQHNVWSNDYSGVTSINQSAFEQVLALIDAVDTGKSEVEGAVIIGERGLGKTQLLARLHHHLHLNDKAFFVYMGEYENLDKVKSELLQALVYSLKREYRPNVTQWQVLAAEMYFEARGDRPCTVEHLVNQFPSILGKNPSRINDWTNGIAHKLESLKNIYLIRAILWTLIPEAAPFAAMWLAGKKLADDSAKSLGLPPDRDGDSFSYTSDLLSLITRYKTVVFCFDELDTPNISSLMLTTAQAVFSLAKDFYKKRIVLLFAMFPKTYREEIRDPIDCPMNTTILAAKDRVRNEIKLEELGVEASLALIEHRLQEFYTQHSVIPPDPFYPFDREKLIQFFSNGTAIARKVLRYCEENWTPQPPVGIDMPIDPKPKKQTITLQIKDRYQQHLQDVYSDIDKLEADLFEEPEKITKALRFAFDHLIDQVVDEMKIFAVIDEQDKAYKDIVPFKVKVRKADSQKGHYAFIGVAVIQKTGVSLTKALEKLVKFNELNQTRACLIRSDDIGGKMARGYALEIIQKGGEWVQFHTDHIAPVLALQSFVDKLGQDDQEPLTEQQIWEYVNQERILINNPLIKEILSKPETRVSKDFKLSDLANLASKLERIPKPTFTTIDVSTNSVATDLKDDVI